MAVLLLISSCVFADNLTNLCDILVFRLIERPLEPRTFLDIVQKPPVGLVRMVQVMENLRKACGCQTTRQTENLCAACKKQPIGKMPGPRDSVHVGFKCENAF